MIQYTFVKIVLVAVIAKLAEPPTSNDFDFLAKHLAGFVLLLICRMEFYSFQRIIPIVLLVSKCSPKTTPHTRTLLYVFIL